MPIQVKKTTEIIKDHPVNPHQDVYLTVTIGNAQIGGSLVESNEGAQIGKGEIKNLFIGEGSQLIGSTITISTNVLDVNEIDPNNGVVLIDHFTNISENYMHVDTAPQGGVVSFIRKYTFI